MVPFMSTVTDLASFRLSRITPEPWGARLARAREAAGYTLRQLDELDLPFSRGVAYTLEQRETAPTAQKSRRNAMTLLILYGFDPADFDLGPDDVPPFIDLRALRDLGKLSTTWYNGQEAA